MPILTQNAFHTIIYIAIAIVLVLAVLVYIGWPKSASKEIKNAAVKDNMESETISYKEEPELQESSTGIKRTGNDTEVVAAIMAAICAHTGLTMNEIRISSIRRVSDNDSNWRKAGIM